MVEDKYQIPDDLNERIRIIENAIKRSCRSLQVKSQDQHIEITGHAGKLEREEKDALHHLGIPHSTYGAKLYKERDEYRSFIKSLIRRGLITSHR
ncbi:MAG TPA: hypothetical protein VJZ03_06655 [Candidatus Bathyarchaeia archaeon]|nr:hypothetical protein [Candidatus Bathyarchaeia archaeon]